MLSTREGWGEDGGRMGVRDIVREKEEGQIRW